MRHKCLFLFLLDQRNNSNRATVLKLLSRDQVIGLSEIFHNLIFGTFQLSPSNLNEIKRYKTIILRVLAEKKVSVKRKKQIIAKNIAAVLFSLGIIRKSLMLILA